MNGDLLQQVYGKYSREILVYLYSLSRDRQLAEDLTQETFVKALLSLPDGHANIRAWLYKVARNLFINHFRSRASTVDIDAIGELPGSEGEAENENMTWYAETAPMGYEYPEQKYLSRFLLRMKLGENADCTVLIQYDGDGVWHHKGTVRGKGKIKSYLIPVLPRRCEYMKLRLEGHGEIHLYGIGRELALGSLA